VLTVDADRPNAGMARQVGWKASRSPLIFFLDGDSVLDPDFLSTAIPRMDDPTVGLVFGWTRELRPQRNIFHHIFDLHWWRPPPGPAEASGGCSLTKREVLEASGGYDARLAAGEDVELCARIRADGYQVLCLDALMILHDIDIENWNQYLLRMARSGFADSRVALLCGADLSKSRRRIWKTRIRLLALAASVVAMAADQWLLGVLVAVAPVWREALTAHHRGTRWYSGFLYAGHLYASAAAFIWGQILFRRLGPASPAPSFDYKSLPRRPVQSQRSLRLAPRGSQRAAQPKRAV